MKRDYQSLLIGTISSLLAMAVYFVVESMWGEELSDSQLTVVVGIIFASIIFPLIANATKLADKSLKNRYSLILMEELKPLLTKDIKKEFEKNIGLFEIYPNFYACEQELLRSLNKTKYCRVFLQIGKSLLSGTTNFYDYICDNKLTDGATIKILHSGKNNPYLTKEIANKRGSHYDEWQVELSYAKKLVGILNQKSKTNIKALQHNEGYYWRMFIFESVAFVQPYLYISNNSEQAPVIKVNKYLSKDERLTNQNSLYVLFSKYFDDKWQAYKNA